MICLIFSFNACLFTKTEIVKAETTKTARKAPIAHMITTLSIVLSSCFSLYKNRSDLEARKLFSSLSLLKAFIE